MAGAMKDLPIPMKGVPLASRPDRRRLCADFMTTIPASTSDTGVATSFIQTRSVGAYRLWWK
jgi:hypothetical protein